MLYWLLVLFIAVVVGYFIFARPVSAMPSSQPDKTGASMPPIKPSASIDPVANALSAALAEFERKKIRMTDQLNPPASNEQISAFETAIGAALPVDAKALYRISNGQKSPFKVTYRDNAPNLIDLPISLKAYEYVGNLFGGYEFLSLDEALSAWQNWASIIDESSAEELADFDDSVEVRSGDLVKKYYAHKSWIPFAEDGGGNAYAFDLDPMPGGKVGQIIVIGSDEDLRRVIAPNLSTVFEMISSNGIAKDEAEDQRYFFDLENR